MSALRKKALAERLKPVKEIDGWALTHPPFAEGAFGLVFQAIQGDRVGAMKIEVEEPMTRVLAEAIYGRRLSSCPGVAPFWASGRFTLSGPKPLVLHYHVTPLLGDTLEMRIRRGTVSKSGILNLGVQLLETLHCIHRAGLVYVDLKPANIVWDPSTQRWTLIDLGSVTSPVQLKRYVFNGTPLFASLRSLKSGGSTPADDLESLALVLQWALSGGTLPWQGQTGDDTRALAALREGMGPLAWDPLIAPWVHRLQKGLNYDLGVPLVPLSPPSSPARAGPSRTSLSPPASPSRAPSSPPKSPARAGPSRTPPPVGPVKAPSKTSPPRQAKRADGRTIPTLRVFFGANK